MLRVVWSMHFRHWGPLLVWGVLHPPVLGQGMSALASECGVCLNGRKKIPGLSPAHVHFSVCGTNKRTGTEQAAFHIFHIRWKILLTLRTCKIYMSMLHYNYLLN